MKRNVKRMILLMMFLVCIMTGEYSNAIVHLFQCFEALVPEKQCMLSGTSAVATFNLQVEALCRG